MQCAPRKFFHVNLSALDLNPDPQAQKTSGRQQFDIPIRAETAILFVACRLSNQAQFFQGFDSYIRCWNVMSTPCVHVIKKTETRDRKRQENSLFE
jgi:hypothetical protein